MQAYAHMMQAEILGDRLWEKELEEDETRGDEPGDTSTQRKRKRRSDVGSRLGGAATAGKTAHGKTSKTTPAST